MFDSAMVAISDGANVDATRDGKPYLQIALELGNYSAALLLVAQGASFSAAIKKQFENQISTTKALTVLAAIRDEDRQRALDAVLETQQDHTISEPDVPHIFLENLLTIEAGDRLTVIPGAAPARGNSGKVGKLADPSKLYRYPSRGDIKADQHGDLVIERLRTLPSRSGDRCFGWCY